MLIRYDILDGLVHACEVVKDQEGYYRAISGFIRGLDGQKTDIIDRLPIHLIQSWRSELMKKNQFMTAEEYQQQCIDHMQEEIPEMNPQSISYYLKS